MTKAQTNQFMHSGTAVADNGVDFITDGNSHTGKWKAFYVGNAANLSSLTESDYDARLGASTGLTGVALDPGYYAANGFFTEVTRASGKVLMVRAVD